MRSLPGVETADMAFWVPLGLGEMNLETKLEGYTPSPNESVAPRMNLVGSGFFDALRVPLVSRRGYSTNATVTGEVVINEAMAKRYWPGHDPFGRALRDLFGEFQVVGVTKTMKYAAFTEAPTPMVFLPVAPWFQKTTPPTLTCCWRTLALPPRLCSRSRSTPRQSQPCVLRRPCCSSPYNLADLEEILRYEVYPPCHYNLLCVAREWGGFDEQRLVEKIAPFCGKRPRWRKPLLHRWMFKRHWNKIQPMIDEIRKAK